MKKSNAICLLGCWIDEIQYTIPPMISGIANISKLVENIRIQGMEPTDYSGSSGIHSLILNEYKKSSIQAFSLWCHLSEYIGEVYSRTSLFAKKVKSLMDVAVDLKEIEIEENLFQKNLIH